MPANPVVLSSLIQTNVDANMTAIAGHSPLAQKNPAFFIQMCTAIGTGIATGSPLITFTTQDSGFTAAPPIPGVGTGVGIVVDSSFFTQDLYTRIRGYVIAAFGSTSHQPYPPSSGNSGEYLLALCKGISDAVKTHYSTAWTLVSAHPTIYAGIGQITDGNFSGLSDSLVKGIVISTAPNFTGSFWPTLAKAISESYVAAIEQHSTGQVTIAGICIPSITQICAIPSTGSGTGTAT